MIRKTIVLAAFLSAPFIISSPAQAEEYCREYTKTVSIGGRAERAYGTACYKPDGSWEITTLEGSDYGRDKVREVIYDDLRDYNRRRHNHERVVIVDRSHYYPHTVHRVHHKTHSVGWGAWPFHFYFSNHYGYPKRHVKYNHKKYHHKYHKHHGHYHGYGHKHGHGKHSHKHKGKGKHKH